MTVKIGSFELEHPVALAPMAGVTDQAYRILCKEQGCGLMYTEMVSAKAIHYKNRNTGPLMEVSPKEGAVALQLFGSDPVLMGEIAATTCAATWVSSWYPFWAACRWLRVM